MLEAICPITECQYRALGYGKDDLVEDVRRHARLVHGKRDLPIDAIEIREILIEPISGCL